MLPVFSKIANVPKKKIYNPKKGIHYILDQQQDTSL